MESSSDNEYYSDDEYYPYYHRQEEEEPVNPPDVKDIIYERPQPTSKEQILTTLKDTWVALYTLWQGFNLPIVLGLWARFEDLYIRFDTLYTSRDDSMIESIRKSVSTPCMRKTQQATFQALLQWCGIDDAECLKGYNQRLSNIYYFNSEKWIEDNQKRLCLVKSSTTGRKRDKNDIYLIEFLYLDPDFKNRSSEWKSSFAYAYRQVITSIASEQEIKTREHFFKCIDDFRRRAKDRRAKKKESEKPDKIKSRKDALKPKSKKISKSLENALKKTAADARFAADRLAEEKAKEKDAAKHKYLYTMERTFGIYDREDHRNTRLSEDEIAEMNAREDYSRPEVEYFGIVLDILISGAWTKNEIRDRFNWNDEFNEATNTVVDAIWNYCSFAAKGQQDYFGSLRNGLTGILFSEEECMNWIFECQSRNIRSIEELEAINFDDSDIDISASQKSSIISAMADFLTYF